MENESKSPGFRDPGSSNKTIFCLNLKDCDVVELEARLPDGLS